MEKVQFDPTTREVQRDPYPIRIKLSNKVLKL